MNGAKTISVIIPVYNTEEYLPRCLDSIINNDYKELEIICVNDGSTDNSLSVLRKYEQNDNRIKVIDVPNGGVSNARNIGLKNASGSFIAFIDSDDWVHRQYFDILITFQKKTNADIVSADFSETDSFVSDAEIEKESVDYLSFDNYKALDYNQNRLYVWGKLYDRKVISNICFEEGVAFGEDNLFILDVYKKNKTMRTEMLKCKLYYYFIREQSAARDNFNEKQLYLYNRQLQKFENLEDKGLAEKYFNVGLHGAIKIRRYFLRTDRSHSMIAESTQLINKYLVFDKKYHMLSRSQRLLNGVFAKHPRLFDFYWKTVRAFIK